MKTTWTIYITIAIRQAICVLLRLTVIFLTGPVRLKGRKTKQAIALAASLFLAGIFWSGTTNAQTISITKKNASLESIFLEISKQTGYNFFYDKNLLQKSRKLTINLKNASLKEVLEVCFQNLPLSYTISDSSITLKQKEPGEDIPAVSSSVKGKITDLEGKPLAGTNIRKKGTGSGTIADNEGNFELKDVDPNTVFEISHIGYESREIIPDSKENITIRLAPGLKILDEVITNGYRSTTRRNNLGSSSKITAEEISRQPVNNPLAAMQGKVPGLIVTQRGGLPGTPFLVQIRGQRSLGFNLNLPPANSPLFIIDGVPFLSSSETMTQRSKIIANSPFNTINPADIESIEILKDANATSIYGSLGANGVILITTKKAKPGKAVLSVNLYSGFGKITRVHDYMNTEQYVQMRKEALSNDGENLEPGNAPDLFFWSNTRYTDWKKTLIGGTARLHNAHVSLSGGSDNTQFAFSIGYNKETTVYPGDHGKQMASVNLNVTHSSADKKLDLVLSTSYGYDKSHLVSTDLTSAIITPPNAPDAYDETGRLNWNENGFPFNNPFSYLLQPHDFIMERLTSGLRLNYKITPCISFHTNAGYTQITADEKLLIPIASQNPAFLPMGLASFGNSRNKNWIVEPQVELARSFWKIHKLKLMAGASFRQRTSKADLQDGFGYTNDVTLNSITGASTIVTNYEFRQYRVASGYGLINYKLNNKYLLEATLRRDGSSRFGRDRKFATFASVATGWIFSKEKFIQDNFSILSFGKLRVSYGTAGNDQIGDYQFLDTWANTLYQYQNPSLLPSRLANNDYRWELMKSTDIGIDLGFYNDRILLSATWNQSRTSDQLLSVTLPAQTGFTSIIKNYPAIVQNRNLEIELNTVNIRHAHFKWSSSVNLSIQKNKLLEFPGIESTNYGTNKFVVGQPLNLAWGYRTDGVDPATGIYRILDSKGNIIPIPTSLPAPGDLVNLGSYNPDFFGGFENSLEYRNWQLHFLFQFVKQMGKHSVYARDLPPGIFLTNQPSDLLKRWQPGSNMAPYQKFTQNSSSAAYRAAFAAASSDLSFTDASFVRLKNISVSYQFPARWIQTLQIRNGRFFLQAQNVITITPFKGNDPETNFNPLGLPPLRLFTAGIQVSL